MPFRARGSVIELLLSSGGPSAWLPGWGRQELVLLGTTEVAARGGIVRVPVIPRFSWPGALIVAAEAVARGLTLMRVWESVDYCLVCGARAAWMVRGSLRGCREWIAGYLGDDEYVRRVLPVPFPREDGPVY